jgi:nucleoside-diphosphate-sugar epimerase
MRIWITGESSFIARNLNQWFKKNNEHVIVNSLEEKVFDKFRTYNCGYKGYYNEIDIFGQELENIIKKEKIDLIIHNAAVVGTDYCTQYKDLAIKTNINGTYKIVNICNNLKIPMMFFSTSVCYRPSNLVIEENDFLRASTIYGATKLACEEIIRTSLETDYVIIIPAMLFGAYDLHSATNKLLMSSLNLIKDKIQINLDPLNIKPFIYIDNFLDAIEIILDKFHVVNKHRINISPDDAVNFYRILEYIINDLKLNPNYFLMKDLDYLGDHVLNNNKIKSLGWKQNIDLFKGIYLTYKKLI